MEKNSILEKELKVYHENKDRLLKKDEGKYVLIKDSEIIGTFESQNDAIKIGIEKFGNTPFLVKKIEKRDQAENFISNLIVFHRKEGR